MQFKDTEQKNQIIIYLQNTLDKNEDIFVLNSIIATKDEIYQSKGRIIKDKRGTTLPNIIKLEGFEKATPITYLDIKLKTNRKNKPYIALIASPVDINKSAKTIYNLNSNYSSSNDKAPNYIYLPKNPTPHSNDNPPLLITPMLKNESIIITDPTPNDPRSNYIVYYDKRPNSSILYDNVVYAFDAVDYKCNDQVTPNIFLAATFDSDDKKWKALVYHDVNLSNKPNISIYKQNHNKYFQDYVYNKDNTIKKIQKYQRSQIAALKDFTLNKKLSNDASLNHNNWKQIYESNKISLANIASKNKDSYNNTNEEFFKDIQSCEDLIKLSSKPNFNDRVVIIDNIEGALLTKDIPTIDETDKVIVLQNNYKNMLDYYLRTKKNQEFINGYKSLESDLGVKYKSKTYLDLFHDLAKKDINNKVKGEIFKEIHFRYMREDYKKNEKLSITKLIEKRKDSWNGSFNNSYDLKQVNLINRLDLDFGVTKDGICYALSLFHTVAPEISTDTHSKFTLFLNRLTNNYNEDSFFFRNFVTNIQVTQNNDNYKLVENNLTLSQLLTNFESDYCKNIMLSGKDHAVSICKIDTNYFYFDPNIGMTSATNISDICNIIKNTVEAGRNNKYAIVELSRSIDDINYNTIEKIVFNNTTIIKILENIRLDKPLETHATNSIHSTSNNPQTSRSVHHNVAKTLNSKSLNGSLPLLGSIRQIGSGSGSTYSIDSVVRDETTGVQSIENKTIIAQEYRAFKYLKDQINGLRTAGIRWDNIQGQFVAWDNALGKFIGVDSVNSFNNKSGKVFAFMELMQFISNRIAGEVLVDESKAELRDFIIAQVAIDLSATAIDTGTELVAPSVRYIKHAITGTGIKTFLNSFGMNGANFLKYANIGFSGLGVALSLASLGLSIKMLTHIDPNKDPHGFKIAVINTAFAAIGTVLSTAALICSMTGLVAFAALFGAIGIIVGLIGMITVGILSLAKASAKGVQAVIDFFKKIDDYNTKPIFENKNGVLIPAGLPITNINYNNGEVTLGKYLTYKSKVVYPEVSKLPGSNTVYSTKLTHNPSINLLKSNQILSELSEQNTVLLPANPNFNFDYRYTSIANSDLPNNDQLSFGLKLENYKWSDGSIIYEGRPTNKEGILSGFCYLYTDDKGLKQIINRIIPELQNTDINITLAPKNKVIIVPALNKDENKGLVTYKKIKTIVSPSSEHQELYFFVGIGSDLTITPTSQKVKYTFDFSSQIQIRGDYGFITIYNQIINEFSDHSNGEYKINTYNTLKLDIDSLEDDSFTIKDKYEEYSYNVKTKKKTYSVIDIMTIGNTTNPMLLNVQKSLPLVQKIQTNPEVLINRMESITQRIRYLSHGLYVKKLNKIITDKDASYLTHLNLVNNCSGGYYSAEEKLVYFYSYTESLIWSIDEEGNLKQIFSLSPLEAGSNNKSFFYSPTDNNYKLTSVTPFKNGGVIAKYTKKSEDSRELTILCNKSGMNLVQCKVSNRANKHIIPLPTISYILSTREKAIGNTNLDLIELVVNGYKNDIKKNLKYDDTNRRILTFNNDTIDIKVKFSNLFLDYDVNIKGGTSPFVETKKEHLGCFNIIEDISENMKEAFLALVDTKEKRDIIKPLCKEYSNITFLGESQGIYYFYSKKEDGKVYIQKGSGSGLNSTNNDKDRILGEPINASKCKDVRLVGNNLIITTNDNSLISYNYAEKIYTIFVANSTLSGTELYNKYFTEYSTLYHEGSTVKLADFVLLNSISITSSANDATEKVYSYLSTYVVLHENYEILHTAQDENNENIRHIWYVSKDNDNINTLYRIDADLSITTYNDDEIRDKRVIVYDNLKNNYSKNKFTDGDNIYKFIPNFPWIKLVNSVTNNYSDNKIYKPDLIPGYILNKGKNELQSFLVINNNGTHDRILVTGNKNIKLIGKVNKDIFFLDTINNKIMVAKKDNNNPTNNYKNIAVRESDDNLFDDITKSNNDVIYSLKSGLNNHTLKLNNSYTEDCNSAYLTNISGNLKVTFEQQFMNQINSCSIDDSNLEKLDLQFPDINDLIISVKGNTVVLHDTLSDFKLVFDDILLATKVSLLNNVIMHYTKDNREATKKLKDIIIKSNNNTLPKDVQDIIISTMEECLV